MISAPYKMFLSFWTWGGISKLTRSRRDSSMLLEYSLSLKSSLSIRELSMSAERCGMLDTQATVLSEAGVGGFNVLGDEPWKQNGHFGLSGSALVNAVIRITYGF